MARERKIEREKGKRERNIERERDKRKRERYNDEIEYR